MKAAFFDMDGVLVDSHDAWFYIFSKAIEHFENKTITREEFDTLVWSKAFDKVAKQYFHAPVQTVRDYYNDIYDEYKKRLQVMKDAEKTISTLKKRGIKLAVISNTQKRVVDRLLKDIGLFQYFDLTLGGDSVAHGKPAPDLLLKGLELLKLEKKDVLFVGDTMWDKMAAERANITFVGFKINGDKRIENLTEVVKLCLQKE